MTELIPSPVYPKAPIVEAVIDIAVASQISLKKQQLMARKLRREYPSSKTLIEHSMLIDAETGKASLAEAPQAFRVANDDQDKVVLIRSNGMATSQLTPYLGWDNLKNRTESVWQVWTRAVATFQARRIGVRYINRIDVPWESLFAVNIEDYLKFYPKNPCKFSEGTLGHIAQVTRQSIVPGWMYTITSNLPDQIVPDHLSVLLDIDVSRTEKLPMKFDDLMDVIEEGRPIKNDLFESCITDKTRALFG